MYFYTKTDDQPPLSDSIFIFLAQLSQNWKHRIVGYQSQWRISLLPSKIDQMKVAQETESETNIAFW